MCIDIYKLNHIYVAEAEAAAGKNKKVQLATSQPNHHLHNSSSNHHYYGHSQNSKPLHEEPNCACFYSSSLAPETKRRPLLW